MTDQIIWRIILQNNNESNEGILDEKEHDIKVDMNIAKQLAKQKLSEICPNCYNSIPKNAKFCIECGHSLIKSCNICSTNNGLNNKYCLSCGNQFIMDITDSLDDNNLKEKPNKYASPSILIQKHSNKIKNNITRDMCIKFCVLICILIMIGVIIAVIGVESL